VDEPVGGRARWRAAALPALGAVLLAGIGVGVGLGGGGSSEHPTRAPTPTTQPTGTGPSATQPAGAGPPAKSAPAGEQFGVNVNRLFNDRAYSSGEIDAQLQALRATGATVARSDALWEAAEPAPPAGGVHHYQWGFDDLIAGSLAEHGLRWLPILDYTAPWDQSTAGQDHSPPRSADDFAAFAAAFARRYGTGGTFWSERPALQALPVQTYEIWNEPDNAEFWYPAPDAASYADLYERARDAIASASADAHVIIGGLTSPASFLSAMLAARPELSGHIDGVAIHPYGPNPGVVLTRLRGARATLDDLGMASVPLYVTEFGWTTSPPGSLDYAPASARPGYIESTLAAIARGSCGVAAVILYTWVTPERDPADREDWFGIHAPGAGASPDVAAFAAGLRQAAAPGAAVAVCGAGAH
jgi:hypothetical protein